MELDNLFLLLSANNDRSQNKQPQEMQTRQCKPITQQENTKKFSYGTGTTQSYSNKSMYGY